jgi:hypothetical protein
MTREENFFHSSPSTHIFPWHQYAPITDEAWFVECVRMLVAPKPFLLPRISHRLLAFQTGRGNKVTKGNIAAI